MPTSSYLQLFLQNRETLREVVGDNSTTVSERIRRMQISRHWRMNPQRYRLQGVRYANGEVSLQARPNPPSGNVETIDQQTKQSETDTRSVISPVEQVAS